MGKIIVETGIHKGEKFCFETEQEKKLLEMARNYFGSSYAFFTVGLGREVYRRAASSTFYDLKNNLSGRSRYVSPEQFELIEIYAELYRKGDMYDEATFERPVL